MAKLTLTDITAGFDASAYNANNSLIEAAFENTLSRDGTTPNTMSAELDMNSNDINNIGITRTTELYLNGVKVTGLYPEDLTLLGSLNDVDLTGLGDGDVIAYNLASGNWEVSGRAALWGGISGTLSDQTDLGLALNAKANLLGGNSFTGIQNIGQGTEVLPTLTLNSDATGQGIIRWEQNSLSRASAQYGDASDRLIFNTSLAGSGFEFRPDDTSDWGHFLTTEAKLGNYIFDTDQTLGAGLDGYALKYDNGSGEISLAEIVAIADGTLTNSVLTWSGTEWTEDTSFTSSAGTVNIGQGTDSAPRLEISSSEGANQLIRLRSASNVKAEIQYFDFTDDLQIDTNLTGSLITLRAETSGTPVILEDDRISLGSLVFNIDQTVGAGQDNYVLTYDDGTGLINLEATGSTSPGGSVNQIQYNDSGAFGGIAGSTHNDLASTTSWLAYEAPASLTSGDLFNLYNNQAGKTGQLARIRNDNASATAVVLRLDQDGTGDSLQVYDSGSIAFSLDDEGYIGDYPGTPTNGQVLTWNNTNSRFESSAPTASGGVVQAVNTQTGAVSTGTTTIPVDDTIPQNTEGNEYMTLAITPDNTANTLKIDVVCRLNHSDSTRPYLVAALFQDTTSDALAAMFHRISDNSANKGDCITFTHWMTAGTTSATTFKVRAGSDTSGTTTFNGAATNRLLGGVCASSITITEYAA